MGYMQILYRYILCAAAQDEDNTINYIGDLQHSGGALANDLVINHPIRPLVVSPQDCDVNISRLSRPLPAPNSVRKLYQRYAQFSGCKCSIKYIGTLYQPYAQFCGSKCSIKYIRKLYQHCAQFCGHKCSIKGVGSQLHMHVQVGQPIDWTMLNWTCGWWEEGQLASIRLSGWKTAMYMYVVHFQSVAMNLL